MEMLWSEAPVRPSLEDLSALGFDTARLDFYRWLVEHGRDPEYTVNSALAERQEPSITSAVSLTWTPAAV